ncbi:MAG: RnfABCDGE type electron transport complex subunit G [Bacteroidales bacterium]|nr:RnfABCDGE type electron transport complex subunit G [Bacteroidales bacterium]
MAKLESTFKNMLLSLMIICILSGAVLAGVSELTREPISLAQKKKLENAIREVVPDFDNDPASEMYKVELAPKDTAIIYPAKKEGKLIGLAIETISMKGFSGEIRIITGLTPDGKIINYEVLSHAETPGLGDKMDPWFKTEKNNQNIIGENLSNRILKVKKEGGSVDAITAATITSVAFLDAVNKAYAAYSGKTDSDSGATSTDTNSGATTQNNNSEVEEKTDGSSEATSKNN